MLDLRFASKQPFTDLLGRCHFRFNDISTLGILRNYGFRQKPHGFTNLWNKTCPSQRRGRCLPTRRPGFESWPGQKFKFLLWDRMCVFFAVFYPMLSLAVSLTFCWPQIKHGRLSRWIKWRACDLEAKEGLENELWHRWSNGSRVHSPTFLSIHLCHNSFSNPSVASPTSQFILQPFFRF